MEEKNVYLNEERYQKTNNKVKKVALVVLLLAILLGGGLIALGVIKSNSDKENNQNKANEIQVQIDAIESQISALDAQSDSLESEISKLEIEKSKIFSEDKQFSDRYYQKETEIQTKTSEKNKLISEKSTLKAEISNLEFEKNKTKSNVSTSPIFYVLGGFIIFMGLFVSLMIFFISKRREIAAYTAQQVMPIAKEGIETVAPAVGAAAKEITKGIKEGLDEVNKNE